MEKFSFSLQYPKPLAEDELDDLIKIAKSGNFSRYASDYVLKLEEELAAWYDCAHAVTCTSGTAALHGALVALDVPSGSEVIMTPVADVGVVIPVIYENLIPVFADIDPETYNISASTVADKITKLTKVVIAVHLAGNPADLDSLRALCDEKGIALVEDFSQAHGAKWRDKKIGSYGDISYGSYQQSKQITCGEGGVIVTNNSELAERAFIGVDKAWLRHLPLDQRTYEFLAPNVRFNALQAAVLKPQLSRLDGLVQEKQNRANILHQMLLGEPSPVKTQKILNHAQHAYYSFPLYAPNKEMRDKIVAILKEKHFIDCAVGYANPKTLYMCSKPLMEPVTYGKGLAYSSRKYPIGTCPVAEDLLERSFLIPFNENFTLAQTNEIGRRLLISIQEASK